MKKNTIHLLIPGLLFLFSSHTFAGECGFGKSGEKLLSGVANLTTSFLEIPKNIYRIGKEIPGKKCLVHEITLGTYLGIVMGIGRTVMGAVDLITFPIPTNPSVNPSFIWNNFSQETTFQILQPCAISQTSHTKKE